MYIGNDDITTKIYYNALTPVKLKEILHTRNKISRSIVFKEFPTNNDKKANIFFNFIEDCRRQISFVTGELLIKMDDFNKENFIESIEIPFHGIGYTDPIKAILENEVYMYAAIKGTQGFYPLESIPILKKVESTVSESIKIEEIEYYNEYRIIRDVNSTTFCFGQSFEIIHFGEDKMQLQYKNSSKVRTLAKDLEFSLKFLEKRCFKIGDIEFNQKNWKITHLKDDKENNYKLLDFSKKIVNFLDSFDFEEDIDLDKLNQEEIRLLNNLISVFVDNETSVENIKKGSSPICYINVGKFRFLAYVEEEEGKYKISDFFKTDIPMALGDENGEKLPVSQCACLKEDDLFKASNIDFDFVLNSFKIQEVHHKSHEVANVFLLNLLNAYDKTKGKKREKLQKLCLDFSNWICEAFDTAENYNVNMLNKLQTIKRIRKFNIDEIDLLDSIATNLDTTVICKVGAYLLLDQQNAAKEYFEKLSIEEQESFRKYPIFLFFE